MFSNYLQVKEFHSKFQLPIGTAPLVLTDGMYPEDHNSAIAEMVYAEKFIQARRINGDQAWGRVQMMLEEVREFAEAVASGNLEKQADSLVDLVYFALGTAVMMGLPWDQLFDEVHRANMEKEPVANAEESRRLNKLDVKKPEGWQPPDIKGVLEKAASFARSIPCR